VVVGDRASNQNSVEAHSVVEELLHQEELDEAVLLQVHDEYRV